MRRRRRALVLGCVVGGGAALVAVAAVRDTGQTALERCRQLHVYSNVDEAECLSLDPKLASRINAARGEPVVDPIREPVRDPTPKMIVALMTDDGRTGGRIVIRDASDEEIEASGVGDYEEELTLDVEGPSLVNGDFALMFRNGTCDRVTSGGGYHPGGWPFIDFSLPHLQATEWAVDLFEFGARRPSLCGDHPGERPLLSGEHSAVKGATARRQPNGTLSARLGSFGRVIFKPFESGRRTLVDVKLEPLADFQALLAHIRRGTCDRRPKGRELPLRRLVPDEVVHEDLRGSEWAYSTTDVEIPFPELRQGDYAVEVHDEETSHWGGDSVYACADIRRAESR